MVELKQKDQRTRKLMTMHKALHPKDDTDRLYVSRKEEGRELTSLKSTNKYYLQWPETTQGLREQ